MTITAVAGGGTHTVRTPAGVDFDELVREHRNRLTWAAFGRTDNWHDAEDAVQDAFIKAWEERASYVPRPDSPPVAWVATLAKYQALNTVQKRWRYVPAGDWAERFADERADQPTDTGLPCMADPDVCAGVYAALAALPDRQRLTVQMYCLQGMDRQSVTRCLRMSDEEFWSLIAKVLARFERARDGAGRTWTTVQTRAGGWVDPELVRLCSRTDLLAKLAPGQRQVLHLRYVEGRSVADTAERMGGISVNSVKSMARFAVARVRQLEKGEPLSCGSTMRSNAGLALLERPDLQSLMGKLTPGRARAFRYRVIENRSSAEVAELMRIGKAAGRTLVSAAVKALTKLAAEADRAVAR